MGKKIVKIMDAELNALKQGQFKHDAYCIYLRKSRADVEAEKLGEGETLKRHKEILTSLAVKRNLLVTCIYEEIVSGETIAARPQIQQMIDDCYAGKYKGIIVIDVDRLSRGNQADMQTIMDCLKFSNNNNGLLVVTPTKTYDVAHNPDDEEYMEFVLFMSRREYKTIQKRLERGKRQAVVEGNYMGSYRPYGYTIKKTKCSRTLEAHPTEAQWATKIFEWAANENMTSGAIAKRLNSLSVPTYRGDAEWKMSTIKCILQNPTYYGKVRWNDRMTVKQRVNGELVKSRPRNNHGSQYMLYDGKHTGLISEELFMKANSRFKSDKTKHNLQLKNYLSGLIFCSKCGKAMRYQGYSTKANTKPRLSHSFETKCNVKSAIYDDVVDAVIYGLKQSLEEISIQVENIPDTKESEIQEEIEQCYAVIRKHEKILNKLYTAWEEDTLSDSEFVERKQINQSKIDEIKMHICELENKVPHIDEYEERITTLHEAIESLQDSSIDAKEKNMFLKAIVERIEFSRENSEEFILDITLK